MIGVFLTSTCFYEGIEDETFKIRIEELIYNIKTLAKHIHQPYELIIVDNSPVDRVPTEQILNFCPENTMFIRYTKNPGKQMGEAFQVRDGIQLSYIRGHKWLLKLTGRYYIFGDWSFDETINKLEESGKSVYIHLMAKKFREMPWAKRHPLYEKHLNSDKYLICANTHVFVAKPEDLVNSKVIDKNYLTKSLKYVNYEEAFWYAIRDLDILYWPLPPIDGWVLNRYSNRKVQTQYKEAANSIFEKIENYKDIPHIDASFLFDS